MASLYDLAEPGTWQNWCWWHDMWYIEATLCIVVHSAKGETFWVSELTMSQLTARYSQL
jgi:hypothetical protein